MTADERKMSYFCIKLFNLSRLHGMNSSYIKAYKGLNGKSKKGLVEKKTS